MTNQQWLGRARENFSAHFCNSVSRWGWWKNSHWQSSSPPAEMGTILNLASRDRPAHKCKTYLSAAQTLALQVTSSQRWCHDLGSRSPQVPHIQEYHKMSTSCVLAVGPSSHITNSPPHIAPVSNMDVAIISKFHIYTATLKKNTKWFISFNTYSLHTYTWNIFNNTDTWWQKWTHYTTYMHAHTHKNTQTKHTYKKHIKRRNTHAKKKCKQIKYNKKENKHTHKTNTQYIKQKQTYKTHSWKQKHPHMKHKEKRHPCKQVHEQKHTVCTCTCTHTCLYIKKVSMYPDATEMTGKKILSRFDKEKLQ
jgi:hypothetical protein